MMNKQNASASIPPDIAHDADITLEQPDISLRRWLLPLSERGIGHGTHTLTDTTEEQTEDIAQLSAEQHLANAIRQCSKEGELLAISTLYDEPYSLSEEEVMQLRVALKEDTFVDITYLTHNGEDYFYSDTVMSDNYAQLQLLNRYTDICTAIAGLVRFECETYPRPLKQSMLMLEPFYYTVAEIDDALTLMKTHPDFQDIQQIFASNNAPYLFSSTLMSYGKARGLTEWLEVEQYENP
ncbi:subunit of oxidoreductase [Proteus mirabilis]|uniref:YdhW family putative oxidoreductase system protein n=2 Tax=Morganellaceae TaxID=1903414 RepID=UPI000BA0C9C6|nr:YdhW family putative oxidoreductase system protein [Proteus mirabilis]NBL81812.1 YdhW family putative oxidoreductase system protein [Proteus sp. G2674]AWR60511.1 subunit of oxidoreductase [Proteus mirabilis]EGT3587055.1 YdhW family putative oxidoreductase system protein [Proteus mirabilis]MBG5979073.1 YdhW family putative oxidoreductase system protein [Proteus mirabilis]MBI6232693.1 YdhW family putative oxidoreductase system protein [Proteus mirabilis]